MKKKKRGRKRPARKSPWPIRFAKNPGVGSLMLMNPAKPPKKKRRARPSAAPKVITQKESVKVLQPVVVKAPAAPAKSRRSGGPRRPKTWRHRTQPYANLLMNKRRSPGPRNENRGLRTLERERRSLLWNAAYGSDKARRYLADHFPRVNPSSAATIGMSVASFLTQKAVAGFSTRIPVYNRLGRHAPVLSSALLSAISFFATRKRPDLMKPIFGASLIGLLDTAIRSYLPSIEGFLGDSGVGRALDAYEDPIAGFVPGYQAMDGYVPDYGQGYAMGDAGDGLGCVPGQGVSGYIPVPVEGIGDYDMMGRPMMPRRLPLPPPRGAMQPGAPVVNVYCPPDGERRQTMMAPRPIPPPSPVGGYGGLSGDPGGIFDR